MRVREDLEIKTRTIKKTDWIERKKRKRENDRVGSEGREEKKKEIEKEMHRCKI